MSGRPKSVKTFIKTVWATVVSPYILLRDCLKTTGTKEKGLCYTCGKLVKRGTNTQAGHWRPRGNLGTIFEEDNLRLQCDVCNDFKRGNGMRTVFGSNLRKEIGNKRVDRILALSKGVKHFTIEELMEIRDNYKKKLEKLEELD